MNVAIDQQRTSLDISLSTLVENRERWAQLGLDVRIDILQSIRDRVMEVAHEWATTASAEKQIPTGSQLEGEEWLSGPYAILATCDALLQTLSQMNGKTFLQNIAVRPVSENQVCARVTPASFWDRILLNGIRADVWMTPGVAANQLQKHTATSYDIPENIRKGAVSLVLGAGNIAAIAPLDCFHKLFTEHSVVLLKMNPVNDYLAPILEKALAPLIDFGALQIASGDAAIGEYLCNHASVDNIHITGADTSHDAIVWGTGAQAETNRRNGTPRNTRTITSELGAVCPTIIVPGPWSKADIRFQAEQVTTQKLHNSGFNCVACQVLVVPERWNRKDAFLNQLRLTMQDAPPRGLYYPGAEQRTSNFVNAYPDAESLDTNGYNSHRLIAELGEQDDARYAECNEVFAPVLGTTTIQGEDTEEYLRRAIAYCNERLHGTLGANIIIHPATRKALGDRWNGIISELKYGCIAINAWTGVGFLAVHAPWGAFPGHTLDDVQSGIGFVHNTYMFDCVERTVVEAPFRPFPRSLLHGSTTMLPRPPWFVTNRNARTLGRLLTEFQYKPGFRKLPRIFLNAFLG